MKRDTDPKRNVLRKIDAHRDVLEAEVDLLRYRLRPFSVLGSAAGWVGKALTFRGSKAPRLRRGEKRGGLDLDTMVWLGIPLLRWFLGRKKKG